MARYALINTVGDSLIELREFAAQPGAILGKARKWLPCPIVARPSFIATTETIDGPTYTVNVNDVTEVWTKRNLTAQEISDKKDAAVATLNGGTYAPQRVILLEIVNDARATRGKLNALIDATGQSGTVTKYAANQTSQINMAQLTTAIKDLLP